MRILAIETATEACSVALFDGGKLLDARHEVLGRGHAERLVPMIAELRAKGRAEEIRVSLGPGSFTGVRIGLAVAKALGIAWQAKVAGYPTLALIAAMARENHPGKVSVCMAGGHGEWFVQDFDASGKPEGSAMSVTPLAAKSGWHHPTLAGNRAREKAQLDDTGQRILNILPDARQALAVPPSLLQDRPAPIYGRGPDAKLPSR